MLAATVFLFMLTTAFWVLTLVSYAKSYGAILVDNLEMSLEQRFTIAHNLSIGISVATDWLASFSVRFALFHCCLYGS
jgi:hypothetical protein